MVLLPVCLALTHCSHDIHEKRTDTIKDHVDTPPTFSSSSRWPSFLVFGSGAAITSLEARRFVRIPCSSSKSYSTKQS